jgi:hypothetical protein
MCGLCDTSAQYFATPVAKYREESISVELEFYHYSLGTTQVGVPLEGFCQTIVWQNLNRRRGRE